MGIRFLGFEGVEGVASASGGPTSTIFSSLFLSLQEQRCGERCELRSGVGNPWPRVGAVEREGAGDRWAVEPAARGEGSGKNWIPG